MNRVNVRGVDIAFESFGNETAETIILLAGLGSQMVSWSSKFCQELVTKGYRVIRFDNRDVGYSSDFNHYPVPDLKAVNNALRADIQPDIAYTLDDMANDVIGLLDILSVPEAHLVGRSMGGMISQIIAAHYPQRVKSLTMIMSSSGNPFLPQTSPDVMALLTQPAPDPLANESAFLNHRLSLGELLTGKGYPFDTERYQKQYKEELRRCYNPAGFGRQIAALVASGDRRHLLKKIVMPALVIHGSDDPLFVPEHGADIARNIDGADFLLIDGMGHDIPYQLDEFITDAIKKVAQL